MRNDGIPMLDTGDNPDAPAPKEMVNLEVCIVIIKMCLICPRYCRYLESLSTIINCCFL